MKIKVLMRPQDVRSMNLWCRENRVPIAQIYMVLDRKTSRKIYIGSRKRYTYISDNLGKHCYYFLIRERDYPLWQLRFG